jgi:acetyl esterase
VSSYRERLRDAPLDLYISTMDRAAHALARVRYAMPDRRAERFDLRLERDVAYGPLDGVHHKLDVYAPARASRPVPVVMYVHGGGFRMLSKNTHQGMALAVARRGYLVFNINYRQGHAHPYPAPLEDACRALLWVRDRCARYGGDPDRIALAGESAGGNLVTALAVASAWRRDEPFARDVFDAGVRLRAVVATYGFLDVGHTDEYLKHPRMGRWTKALLRDAARSYLGREVAAQARANPLSSPVRIIEGGTPDRPLPPFLASVGTRDPLIRCSKRLKAALDELGGECALYIEPGEMHGYDALAWRPSARAMWKRIHAFLDRHLRAGSVTEDARAAV